MRTFILVLIGGIALTGANPVLAGSDGGAFLDGVAMQVVAQEKKSTDAQMTREEIRERKRELREEERDLREQERAQTAKRNANPRFWIGVGTGAAWGSVNHPCSSGSTSNDCSNIGDLRTYSANITMTGPHTALRLRGVREVDKGKSDRTPYEEAALIGSRFGSSNWYGMAGFGRIVHPADNFQGDASGFAWEILFAPSTEGGAGLELSFHGNAGSDVEYVAFTLGLRLGALR